MDSGLNRSFLVMAVVIFCCSTPGQTQELISTTGEHFDDYRISGSIYVLHVNEVPDSLTDLLLDHIETYGHVIVKFAGNPISIVRDAEALRHLLHEPVHHSNNITIAQDLLNVAYISERNSHLLLVVDEHEAEKTADTDLALASLRGSAIRVDVIQLSVTSGGRYRRQSSVNFYQLLANVSGGSVITTDKNNIGSAVNTITQTLLNTRVDLMRLSYSGAAGTSFMVFVDNTITQLFIRVQAERAQPFVIAQMPSGVTSSARPTVIGSAAAGSVVALLEINITQASDYGIWKIVKMDNNVWDVTIQATSPVDFTHKFVEPGSGGSGEYEIKGRPISGTTYKMVVELHEYAKVSKMQSVFLMTRNSLNPKAFGALQNVGGRRGNSIFYANITIPDESFMVAIQGQDNAKQNEDQSYPPKHPLRRLDPNLITPVTLRLFIPPLTGVTLWANETLDIPFTVQNTGAVDQDIDVRIEDDNDFALEPKIHSFYIKAGMNETEHFTIKGGPKVGVTTTVTINAKPFVMGSMSFQSGQFDIRRLTVMGRTSTTTQSTITPMSTTMSTTTHSTSTASTADISTLSSQLSGSTTATASGHHGASNSTAGGTQSHIDTSYSSGGAQSMTSAPQSQASAGTPQLGGSQSSPEASTVTSGLPQSTQAPVGTPKAGSLQSSSGPSTVTSGLPQSATTQAPSGTPHLGTTQTTKTVIGRWYGRRSSDRCVMTLVKTCFPDF